MTKLIALNKTTNTAVVASAGLFVFIDTERKDVVKVEKSFTWSDRSDWSRAGETLNPVWSELAEAATTDFSITKTEHADKDRVFRVPNDVQRSSQVFSSSTTTLSDIHSFASESRYKRQQTPVVNDWVNKITAQFPIPESLVASGFLPEPTSVYFGRAMGEGTECDAMYALNGEGQWAERVDGAWVPVEGEDPGEMYNLIMLDAETAASLADWADEPDELDGGSLELSTLNPEELGLFYAAEAELDFEFIDRLFDVYDSTERSINAKKQVRAPGGKFGPSPGGGEATADKPKARLSISLPLIPNVTERINQYLAEVETQRGGSGEEQDNVDSQPEGDTSFAVTARQSGAPVSDVKPLYIAIVDAVDTDAVLDLVSLVPPAKGVAGDVTAWKRAAGQWVVANDLLAQLRGSVPPSCVELTDPALLKEVIAQVDKSTAEEGVEEKVPGQTEVAPDGTAPASQPTTPQTAPIPVKTSNFGTDSQELSSLAARGYAFSDGTLLIRDASDLRKAVRQANGVEQQLHVIKRARALNRIDMIPNDWDMSGVTMTQGLWGPYGELLPVAAAGGLDQNRGGAERLRHYWTHGIGGKKIGWGQGQKDWTRCVAYLSKYLGVRAKGYCALRHFEMNGYYPGDKRNK